MRKCSIFGICIVISIIGGCSFNTQETFIIKKINLYDKPEKNEQLGRDLIFYDYSSLIIKKIGIKSQSVLKDITWQYFVETNTKEVTFRLILNNEARSKKEELVHLFEDFLGNKLNEYKLKESQIDSAVTSGIYYIHLIETAAYDSLWSQTSPSAERFGNKDQYIKVFSQRNIEFKPKGKMKVYTRLFDTKLGDLKGDFYTITYEYEDGKRENVTLERINNTFKLLGYRFMSSNNNA